MLARSRWLLAVLAGSISLAFAVSASAVPISDELFQIELVGVDTATLNGNQIGCENGSKPGTYNCVGSDFALFGGDLVLDSWNFALDEDPSVNNNIVLTNNTGATQTVILSVVLPVLPVVPSSLIGGSIQGGITSDGTAGTLSSNGLSGNAIYTALIDGAPVATLLPDPSSISAAGPFLSASFTDPPFTLSFGNPIPSQPAGPVLSDIGITLEFTLTPGDSASFTSVFVVVPEPGTFGLVSLGLLGIAALRRRARR